ncbi:WD domain repeat-containing protein 55 [Coemansia sp. RSA 1813]|nr:WD domain repeat-containing protein 55 [Coemansia sp. RSA 1646]KAJ1767578.1 WD domain repeat-containing protein 55 [Coemansia sp. RSA 1843]KAJ2086999.1 WD domain repeat-containing protein 55 [Coemansia sp. RSA 986]KAJ2215582.1 WD domain repeat-containing protein 55 [Coemansia sp. RSA 487]KAJ2565437.1 WD domain repeat-containing protein 55 [Coemansia sp. RSA 1813]
MDDSVERPKPLRFKEPVIDVAFNPKNSLVASSLITGHVFVHRYAMDGNERVLRQRTHRKSCRSVCFSGDGSLLYSASKDKAWVAVDVESGGEMMRMDGAHESPLNLIHYVNEQIVATGDEAGGVKLWDVRKNKPAFSYTEHVDYISDMVFNEPKRHLLTTSGDGCLSVYDVRKAKPFHVSANQDDELLSVALMRGGSKVVVGETAGVLGIFSYGQFDDVSDRFPGHPQSIDALCKLTEDLCVTGSSDGLLRIVQLFPHRLVGVAGDHHALPVEKIVLSHDQEWLASCSHDHSVHFWDIGYIFNGSDNECNDDVSDNDSEDHTIDIRQDAGSADAAGNNGSDVQEIAIRISKEVSQDNCTETDIDIDGCSDASEMKRRDTLGDDDAPVGSDAGESSSEVNIDDDDDSDDSDAEEKDNEEPKVSDGIVHEKHSAVSIQTKPVLLPADEKDADQDGSDGRGSSDDDSDDDDGGGEGSKRKKRKLSKREKQKAKRKARKAMAAPSEATPGNSKKTKKAKAFFSGL